MRIYRNYIICSHFPHSAFSTLLSFHTPHFPHSHFPPSAFSTPRTPCFPPNLRYVQLIVQGYCHLIAFLLTVLLATNWKQDRSAWGLECLQKAGQRFCDPVFTITAKSSLEFGRWRHWEVHITSHKSTMTSHSDTCDIHIARDDKLLKAVTVD